MSVNDNQAVRNHYWNLTHELPAEVMGQIEHLVRNAGRCFEWLDMGPISREQILARVRRDYGDKAVEVAEQLPWLKLH
jgi:hypothetical protein